MSGWGENIEEGARVTSRTDIAAPPIAGVVASVWQPEQPGQYLPGWAYVKDNIGQLYLRKVSDLRRLDTPDRIWAVVASVPLKLFEENLELVAYGPFGRAQADEKAEELHKSGEYDSIAVLELKD